MIGRASIAGISTRFDRCAPTATNTASNRPSRRSASRSVTRWSLSKRTPSALIRATSADEHVARQAVGGDAVAHHPAGLGARVADLDLVPQARQVVGGRQAARAGADDQHALSAEARAAARSATPARARGRRGSARPRGSRRRCRGSRGCSCSRTGGSRRGRGSLRAGCRASAGARPARARPPARARAIPGCPRPPGRPRCRAAAGRRKRVVRLAPAPTASVRARGPAEA